MSTSFFSPFVLGLLSTPYESFSPSSLLGRTVKPATGHWEKLSYTVCVHTVVHSDFFRDCVPGHYIQFVPGPANLKSTLVSEVLPKHPDTNFHSGTPSPAKLRHSATQGKSSKVLGLAAALRTHLNSQCSARLAYSFDSQ